MTSISLGDQARAFALQSASHRIKTTMATLSAEMASGEVADIPARFQGNTQILRDVETRIDMIGQFKKNASEAAFQTQAMTDVLVSVKDVGIGLSNDLLTAPFSASRDITDLRARQAGDALHTMVSQLNGSAGQRFLFSGFRSDVQPLVAAEQILTDLTALTGTLMTASDIADVVSDWFDAAPGAGGFIDRGYRGAVGDASELTIGEGKTLRLDTTAISPAIRGQLKAVAIAALAGRAILGGNEAERNRLLQLGGAALLRNSDAMIGEAGRMGLSQATIEVAQTESTQMLSTLETSRNTMRGADPYETAAALTQAQTQLETLYAVTARLSKLRLVDFLR